MLWEEEVLFILLRLFVWKDGDTFFFEFSWQDGFGLIFFWLILWFTWIGLIEMWSVSIFKEWTGVDFFGWYDDNSNFVWDEFEFEVYDGWVAEFKDVD